MKFTRRLSFLLATLLFSTFPVTSFLCGTERWEVKVCQDAHVKYLFKDFDADIDAMAIPQNANFSTNAATKSPQKRVGSTHREKASQGTAGRTDANIKTNRA